MERLLAPVKAFLHGETPGSWIEEARRPERLAVVLQDHLLCELKAAQTAVWLLRRYALDKGASERLQGWVRPFEDRVYRPQLAQGQQARASEVTPAGLSCRPDAPLAGPLVEKMVRLIKEELHHFEQVRELMLARGVAIEPIRASRYAASLMQLVRKDDPWVLVDRLIIGAYIEARSCERFAALAPYMDEELERFYVSLLRSEARHYQDYLALAQLASPEPIDERVREIGEAEWRLMVEPDPLFRFHSGVPSGL
ncbi:tRNA isopentenyl-2-thiomethyl-A-37 hydroxylase MiaE [Ferrimonas sp. YFM]|uniref:tRNA isopentenyl-2-thiomethyl-A-37 hydroxylase MiaE n=1 Tax=Ferrimonas sp. YFM TaxID=3028878 RepID=UPI00257371C3|nr:tRNA isopentenyl-2-thiomethyl-A-37 hydroxylase MiaE [Ferrimonas sp. YFM]BDY05860.1 tRNA-(ms[2]io[6]A)-hydroxylase [Ferrimonas sp. YFM]